MFNDYLRERDQVRNETTEPFVARDYAEFVDGRPRLSGVRAFLASRGIALPEGRADDPAAAETVNALGNRKNNLFQELLVTRGVRSYDDGTCLLRAVKARGTKTAAVSSSTNCQAVLVAAHLDGLFDERVDGQVAERLRLAGKPEPDTYLEATRRLDVTAARTAVIEDALAGVEAGRAGGFGLVVGVDRVGQAKQLLAHGADVVVSDLRQLVPIGNGT
jgi:HAD superfamily hydrolase (TIGR01509 family)